VFAALLLVQCSNEEADPATEVPELTPTPVVTVNPQPTATPFTPPTPVPAPTEVLPPANLERGGILRMAIPEGAPHLDPHLTVSSSLVSWGSGLAYSRLLKFDSEPDSTTIICDICESWTQTTPLSFEFKLRDDVFWQPLRPLNGRKLTAQDVEFSLNRQREVGSPNAALLSNISEITTSSDSDLTIRLISPDAEALEKLADAHSRIIPREVIDQEGDLRRGPTIGSGPWMTIQENPEYTELIANPDYYAPELPYLDGVSFQVMPNTATRVTALRTKIIDVVQANDDLIVAAIDAFEDIERITTSSSSAGVEVALNTNRAPFDSPAFREVTWNLMNPSAWFESSAIHANVQSAGLPGSPGDRSSFEGLFNDHENANSILATGGFTSSDNLVIRVGEYGPDYIDTANHLAGAFADVGIRADVDRVSTRVFADDVWIGGNFDISVGAPAPIHSISGYLLNVHHSQGSWNTTGISDAELDRLIEIQAMEYNPGKRNEILKDLQERIIEAKYRLLIATRNTHWAYWNTVEGWDPYITRGDTDFLTRVWKRSG